MTRVLVIDDDKAVGTAIKMVLEVAGFEVIHALDCTSGLAAIEKTDFQLIMIDLFMPGIWTVTFSITPPSGPVESVVFSFCIDG